MTIFYELGSSLYVNVTNKCPCACIFCIRNNSDVIKDSDSMWFEDSEPSMDEIKADFERFQISKYDEIVFCGYGEPLERLDIVIETAKFLREKCNLPIRLNTNGLSDLIAQREHTAFLLKGLIDTVSISLNAPDAQSYARVTNSIYGEKSFDALLSFAKDAKETIEKVIFTVVDVIDEKEIEECEKIARKMDIPLRVRKYVQTY